MAYRGFLLALVTSDIPLIQFAAWTSSLTYICVGCPKSKLLNNSFKNKLLTRFHSVLSQMWSVLNIWWLRFILILLFSPPDFVILLSISSLVLIFFFSEFCLFTSYVYYLGVVIANLWNNRNIGPQKSKAKENTSSGKCHN